VNRSYEQSENKIGHVFMRNFEVIVLGLGAMGSAIAYHLAAHGSNVLGLEKFSLNHTNGSSHGGTRIIRTAVFPQTSHVPLVQRAFELWSKLQAESGRDLMKLTGALLFGLPESPLITGCKASSREHQLPYHILSRQEVGNRFPIFQPDDNEVAFHEKNAGVLFPEECIQAHASLAEENGATLRFNEPVTRWEVRNGRVEVRTDTETYLADYAVFSPGAWLPSVVPELELPLQIERQTVFWFTPQQDQEQFTPNEMPAFDWQLKDGRFYYGTPNFGSGVKVALHHGGELTTPDKIRRQVTEDDETPVKQFLRQHISSLDSPPVSSATCMYTNTPDDNFIIDFHPSHSNIVLVSACSGHGFKFSSAIGEVVQQMVQRGDTDLDISQFKADRFRGEIS